MKAPGFSIAPVMERTLLPGLESRPRYAMIREGTVIEVIKGTLIVRTHPSRIR